MTTCSGCGKVIVKEGDERKEDLCSKCMTEALERIKGYSRKIPYHHKVAVHNDF